MPVVPWQVSRQWELLIEGWLLPMQLVLLGLAAVGFVAILVIVIVYAARDLDQ